MAMVKSASRSRGDSAVCPMPHRSRRSTGALAWDARRPYESGRAVRDPAGPGLVGAVARRARAHPLRRRRAERPARGRRETGCQRPQHGPLGPGPLAPGARGVRHVNELIRGADLTILVYFLVLNSFYALLLVLSIP